MGNRKKINFLLLMACALLTGAALWATFHGTKHDFFIPASAIRLQEGSVYITALPARRYWLFENLSDSPGRPDRSKTELFENGKPLGPAHSIHDDIRNAGLGRFSHWGSTLYFSTSDNSDPRANGHIYKATITATLPIWMSSLLGVCLSISLFLNRRILKMSLLCLKGKLALLSATSPLFIPIVLFLVTAIIRLPYFFYSVLDWDESTYILMGGDVLRGNLPFVTLWANQPPLVYFHYALFLLVFGKSIIAVRLAGFLCVFISAFLLYRLAKRIYSTMVGFWLAIFHIIFSSLIDGQATMSEHLILIPLILTLQMFLLNPASYKNSVLLGLLSGYMTLTRTNMAFFALTLGMIILYPEIKRDRKSFLLQALAFSAGSLAPVGFISLIYWANDSFPLLFKSFFMAPFVFVSRSPDTLHMKAGSFLLMIFNKLSFPAGYALMSLSALGFAITLYRHKHSLTVDSPKLIYLPLLAVPICFSIILWGTGYEHYLMLLFPVLILLGGASLSFILQTRFRKALIIVLSFTLFSAISGPAQEWLRISQGLLSGRPLFEDTGYLVSDYLNRRGVSDKYVYFLEYHIGYFLTNAKIPTRYAHPAAICREAYVKVIDGDHATPEEVLRKILEKKPTWIVRRERVWYFDELCPKNNEVLQRELDMNYEMETKVGDAHIYRRKRLS